MSSLHNDKELNGMMNSTRRRNFTKGVGNFCLIHDTNISKYILSNLTSGIDFKVKSHVPSQSSKRPKSPIKHNQYKCFVLFMLAIEFMSLLAML